MNSICLLSGGMDSTFALYQTLQQCRRSGRGRVVCLTIDYGQRHTREVQSSKMIYALALNKFDKTLVEHRTVTIRPGDVIPHTGSLMGKVETDRYETVPVNYRGTDSSYVPHRNLLFITLAAAWARYYDADTIVTGLRDGFSDCVQEFDDVMNKLLTQSDMKHPVSVVSPARMSRSECIVKSQRIPGAFEALAFTWSCYNNRQLPCGTCLPCVSRAKGFREAGVDDPLLVRLRSYGNAV